MAAATKHKEPARRDGDHYVVPAVSGGETVMVLLDVEDFERLTGAALSIGSHGYAQALLDGKFQFLHRWILGISGKGRRVVGDHINRDRLDNRRCNLRAVDASISNANRSVCERSGVGVYLQRSGRYQAKFSWRGRRVHVGTFDSHADAAEAVRRYREQHHPDSIPPTSDSLDLPLEAGPALGCPDPWRDSPPMGVPGVGEGPL